MNRITYDEFREEVEKLGFQIVEANNGDIWVETLDRQTVSRIGNKSRYSIKIHEVDAPSLAEIKELSIRLAITPLDEREDRYYLRLKSPIMPEAYSYLNCGYGYKTIFTIFTKECVEGYQTIFTKEEIDKLNEKYNVLDSFRMEEVK